MSELQPSNTDTILGGQNPPPLNAAVLGGVDGAKRKLAHELGLSDELAAELIQTHDIFSFETVTVNKYGDIVTSSKKQAFYYTEDLGEGISLDMVYISAGSFIMGSSDDRELVNVTSFHIGKYPITQEQYQVINGNNPAYFNDFFKGYLNNNRRPIEQILWKDTQEFCSKLKCRTEKVYNLPTEIQWEYACRAGTNTPFYFGDTITTRLANYAADSRPYANESAGIYRQQTTIVGSFPANNFGLYDMHGNVWEWCEDSHPNKYKGVAISGSVWNGGDEKNNFIKGGAWNHHHSACCSGERYSFTAMRGMSHCIGFRVVV